MKWSGYMSDFTGLSDLKIRKCAHKGSGSLELYNVRITTGLL